MQKLFQRSHFSKQLTGAGLVLIVGMAVVSRRAHANNYQRLSAVDCTCGNEEIALFDYAVNSSRFFARNLETNSRAFFCAIPMESNLNTDKINAITFYGYLGHNGDNSITSDVEDIVLRPCAMIANTGGQCAQRTYSTTPLSYKTIPLRLDEDIMVPNIFTNKPGYTAYIRVDLPGVDVTSSRVTGFLIDYLP
jgi:hypothetical protein